ncbi:conjugative transposon protein TraJ [Mucilaginibacter sp. L3T2-6]|uniref:conjugative transposon protein TraJ n=1 Tax=Mucilaginibacter sp. L3T2-6 TaxID=3062491 RepID=UPI002675057C|nr:conjugative transposon protein TraJ [Mucilaginibacter sp. L3T2-6]MDO3641235.1 conjugative transposon protein TraJ [Mucilaginibacter sp. L3T2-6]MDV6214006.1 conjugative transposon protein TraJ [Mucilaginibacter sp. L3T2-6]
MKRKKITLRVIAALCFLFAPALTYAQGVASDLHSLQGMLNDLYSQMMPLCAGLIGVARAVAGFATLWYIGARVWKHLAAAEPVDIYPLLRPFAIGFCILVFPSVLTLMNGVLQPVVDATHGMVTNTNQAIETMLANQQAQINTQPGSSGLNNDPDKWYQYSHPDDTGNTAGAAPATNLSDQFSGWGWKNMVKKAIAEMLNVLFEAAALCIDTIRTFKLIVLAILGPLCFGLGVFDGFQHTIKQWIARYVNVFMWLPVANIFGAIIARIQENMLLAQQNGTLGGNGFGNENTAYLIFLVIGIVGYFTVPGIANYIMNVGGHALFSRTSALASMAVSYVSGSIMQGFFSQSPPPPQPPQNNPGNANNGQLAARDKLSGSGKT